MMSVSAIKLTGKGKGLFIEDISQINFRVSVWFAAYVFDLTLEGPEFENY